MQPADLQRLLEKYFDETISESEFKELWETLSESSHDAVWFKVIESSLHDKGLHGLSDPPQAAEALASIKQNKPPVRKMATIGRFFKYAAILLLIATAAWLWQQPSKQRPPAVIAENKPVPHDLQPGGDRAMLTLADGSTIVLDSAANGQIAKQGSVQVVKLSNGQLQYQFLNGKVPVPTTLQYNTMSTPRGGQYRLTLPDGTLVWLNAESSITYPTVFGAAERSVTVTGEAYLEVAKEKNRPFRVMAGDANIEVLGTHFNINAYANEGHTKTSLLEGSVKINSRILQPGQAFANGEVFQTNVARDVAWKNGVFNFNDQNLAQVMRQLARWYNLEVEYPLGVPKKEYGGEMGRNLSLSQVLKGLESTGLRFDLNERKLTVKP